MRKLLFGLAGAAALGLAGLASQPAQAQGFSLQFGNPGYYGGPYYGPRVYGPGVGVGVYGDDYDYGPNCVVRVNRYWDGYQWVRERRRICR
jgi:hypothetical protein